MEAEVVYRGFPAALKQEASAVLQVVSKRTCHHVPVGETEQHCIYTLLDGQTVSFPYRIYWLDESQAFLASLTFEQKMMYHAWFTRSCDGFIRQNHISAILTEDYPDWLLPYILKLSDEYVVEILETIYSGLRDRGNDRIKDFCRLNIHSFLYSHDRMISYWNEFYRDRCLHYKDYIGNRLFSECFGYTKSMEKFRRASTRRKTPTWGDSAADCTAAEQK